MQAIIRGDAAGIPKMQVQKQTVDIWEINDDDRMNYQRAFSSYGGEKGILEQQEAMSAFLATKLAPEYLSRVWNLADPNDTGMFYKNQFFVALHLITRIQQFKEPVPDKLPPALEKVMKEPVVAEPFGGNMPKPSSDLDPMGMNMGMSKQEPAKKDDDPFGSLASQVISGNPQSQSVDVFGFGNPISTPPSSIQTNPQMSSSISTSMTQMPSSVSTSMNQMSAPTQSPQTIPSQPSQVPPQMPPLELPKTDDPMASFDLPQPVQNPVQSFQQSPPKEPVLPPKPPKVEPSIEPAHYKHSESMGDESLEELIIKWKDIRSMLSIERERNQMLVNRLQELSKESLDKNFAAVQLLFKD